MVSLRAGVRIVIVDDVTVVIPTFSGRERFVKRAAESAGHQARVIVQHDAGLPKGHAYACWWEGIYRASTPYVALLFDDDWYEPGFVARVRSAMVDDVAYVWTQAQIRYPDGTSRLNISLSNDARIESQAMEAFLLKMPFTISPGCAVFRRADALQCLLVGGVPGRAEGGIDNAGSDVLMMLLPLLKYSSVYAIADPLVNFDAGEQSTTMQQLKSVEGLQQLEQSYRQAKEFYGVLRRGRTQG